MSSSLPKSSFFPSQISSTVRPLRLLSKLHWPNMTSSSNPHPPSDYSFPSPPAPTSSPHLSAIQDSTFFSLLSPAIRNDLLDAHIYPTTQNTNLTYLLSDSWLHIHDTQSHTQASLGTGKISLNPIRSSTEASPDALSDSSTQDPSASSIPSQ